LVGSDVVVDVLPLGKRRAQGGQAGLGVGDLVELLGVGAVGSLDRSVELGRAGRQDE
jgi:hypothetical protein